jgi:hypothetical protein
MRIVEGFSVVLLVGGGLLAQSGGFGSAQHPGRIPATNPGLTRSNGNVGHPGPGGPRAPSGNFPRPIGRPGRPIVAIPYAYPIYVGGYGYGYGYGYWPDTGYAPDGYAPDAGSYAPSQAQQPNVIVIYPQTPPAAPQNGPEPDAEASAPPAGYTVPAAPQSEQRSVSILDPSHYLIAFKDHTIYSAVAYWVEGDTLHYFTSGNTHNQVSMELVDRALTDRLNKESGVEMHLPPANSGQ